MSHRKSDLGIPCPRKICQSSAARANSAVSIQNESALEGLVRWPCGRLNRAWRRHMTRGGTPHLWHRTTRVHEAAWRRGGVAAHRARAAAREGAPHRRADHPYGERFRSSGLGISAQRGASKVRLGAGSQHHPDRIWAFAAELVELAPDVILCSGAQTTTVLQRVTHTFNGNSDGIGQMNMRASVESEWAHARRP